MSVSCPSCGNVNYQKVTDLYSSSEHYECGVCGASYSVKRESDKLKQAYEDYCCGRICHDEYLLILCDEGGDELC